MTLGSTHYTKYCPGCDQTKSVEEFGAGGKRGRDGYCLPCRRSRDKARAEAKAARPYDPDQRRDYVLRRLYGISLDEYNAMADSQNNVCAICLTPEKRSAYGERPRLVVDHNHVTNKVRGLLCASCNGRLNSIEDEQFMLRAMEYLERTDAYEFLVERSA